MPEVLAIILGLGTALLAQARVPAGDAGGVTLFNWFVLLGAAAVLIAMFFLWAGQTRRHRRVPPSPPPPR